MKQKTTKNQQKRDFKMKEHHVAWGEVHKRAASNNKIKSSTITTLYRSVSCCCCRVCVCRLPINIIMHRQKRSTSLGTHNCKLFSRPLYDFTECCCFFFAFFFRFSRYFFFFSSLHECVYFIFINHGIHTVLHLITVLIRLLVCVYEASISLNCSFLCIFMSSVQS